MNISMTMLRDYPYGSSSFLGTQDVDGGMVYDAEEIKSGVFLGTDDGDSADPDALDEEDEEFYGDDDGEDDGFGIEDDEEEY